MAPGSPQPPRPDDGLQSFLVVVAEEEGLRCLAGDPREADLSKLSHEAGPASGPREAGHTTLGEGHGRRIVLLLLRCPKVTGRRTYPIGVVEPSVTLEKGLAG